MAEYTAHTDTFARDHLPAREQWPDLIFSLPELQYPRRMNCAVELLDSAIEKGWDDLPCLIGPGGTWRYGELHEQVNRIARVLTEDLSLAPGNRVLLRGANNPMMVACWFAVTKAGGIAVPTMPLLRAVELSYILEKAQVGLALCDMRLAEELDAAGATAPVLDRTVLFGSDAADGLESLMADKPATFEAVETAVDDVCLIAFTSGTTGQPKGTMHAHRDVMAMCDCFPPHILKPRPDDIFCGSPPIAFTFGLGGLVTFPVHIGAATLLLEKAPPDVLLPEHSRTVARFPAQSTANGTGCEAPQRAGLSVCGGGLLSM